MLVVQVYPRANCLRSYLTILLLRLASKIMLSALEEQMGGVFGPVIAVVKVMFLDSPALQLSAVRLKP